MKVLLSGASGFIGTALGAALRAAGHQVTPLVRAQPAPAGAVSWDPQRGEIDAVALAGHDAAIHLAGEPIAARWTADRKQHILESRVQSTRLLAGALARLAPRPRVLVCASAIGYYGDRGDELLREESAPGTDFLAGVCREWEAACAPAAQAGIRVINLRTGIVLSTKGGALPKMLPPFRLGVGGVLGSGRQWMSWIALDDLLAAYQFALTNDTLAGPVNAVAPNPVTNRNFTKTLGRVLRRPTIFPVPALVIGLLFGEMGRSVLLGSQRVEPARLSAAGFRFQYAELEPALRHLLP